MLTKHSMCEIYNKTHDLGLVDIHGDKECRHHFLFFKGTFLSFAIACLRPGSDLYFDKNPDSRFLAAIRNANFVLLYHPHRFWIQSAKQFSVFQSFGLEFMDYLKVKTKRNACIMVFLGVQRSFLRAWRKSNLLKNSEPPLNFLLMATGIGITEGSQNGIFKLLVVRPGIGLILKWKGN